MQKQKELRFTRSAQGSLLGILTAGFLCSALLGSAWAFRLRTESGELGLLSWLAIVTPIASASTSLYLSQWFTQRTYLLLSAVGIEVFPLRKPEENLEVFPWHEIQSAEVLNHPKALHLQLESKKEYRIPLTPLSPDAHQLLRTAIQGRLQERKKTS